MHAESPKGFLLVEKASTIALKFLIRYDPDRRVFVGPPYSCAAAQQQLDAWVKKQKERLPR